MAANLDSMNKSMHARLVNFYSNLVESSNQMLTTSFNNFDCIQVFINYYKVPEVNCLGCYSTHQLSIFPINDCWFNICNPG